MFSRARWSAAGWKGVWVYEAGLVVLTVLFLLIRFRWLQFPLEAANPQLGGSLFGTLMADVKIQAWFLFQAFVPVRLSALYPASFYTPRVDAQFVLSLAGLLGVAAAFVFCLRRRLFVCGILWWFIFLAPVANIYPIFNPMAERYVFLPSVGLCILVSDSGFRMAQRRESLRRPLLAALALWTVIMSGITVSRNRVWKDNLTLWQETETLVPGNPTVVSNLAAAHFEKGNIPQVIAHGRRAIALSKSSDETFNPAATYVALAAALHIEGQRKDALAYLLEAEDLIPCRFDIDAAIYRNIGLIYDDEEDLNKAAAYYRKAIEIDPYRAGLWHKLSFCHLRLGQREAAAREWARARELDPRTPPFDEIVAAYEASK